MNSNGNAPVTAREETALSIREEISRELSTASQAAMAQHEVQSAITVAIKFPRNEDEAFGKLMKSCSRATFADKSIYSFPRGGTNIEGPSSHLAREAARIWGNIRYGFEVVGDDDENIHLRGFAWDMQTNSKATQDARFRKLVQRKRAGKTEWVKPDERDLRELINKHGAIAERNCILKIIPADLVEEAMLAATATLEKGASTDIDGERKKIIAAFSTLNISVADLESYLGKPLKHATPAQVTQLRGVYKSIKDGNTSWHEYTQPSSKPAPNVQQEASIDDLLGAPTPAEAATDVEHPEPEGVPASTVGDLATLAEKLGCPEDECLNIAEAALGMPHQQDPEAWIRTKPWPKGAKTQKQLS